MYYLYRYASNGAALPVCGMLWSHQAIIRFHTIFNQTWNVYDTPDSVLEFLDLVAAFLTNMRGADGSNLNLNGSGVVTVQNLYNDTRIWLPTAIRESAAASVLPPECCQSVDPATNDTLLGYVIQNNVSESDYGHIYCDHRLCQ